MSDDLEENNIDKLYIWLSDTTNEEIDLVQGNNIFISQGMDERWGYSEQNEDDQEGRNIAKKMRAYILVSCLINGETWLNN